MRRLLVIGLIVAAVLLTSAVALAWVPFSVAGSAEHSSPFSAWMRSCPNDDGEAVAAGQSEPGARQRCEDEARRRLLGATGAVVVAAVELGFVTNAVGRNAERSMRLSESA